MYKPPFNSDKTRLIDLYVDEFQVIFEKAIDNKFRDALKSKTNEEELLTRDQVIKRLHIAPSTLSDYTKKGLLVSYNIGHRVYYKWSEILNSGIKINKSRSSR